MFGAEPGCMTLTGVQALTWRVPSEDCKHTRDIFMLHTSVLSMKTFLRKPGCSGRVPFPPWPSSFCTSSQSGCGGRHALVWMVLGLQPWEGSVSAAARILGLIVPMITLKNELENLGLCDSRLLCQVQGEAETLAPLSGLEAPQVLSRLSHCLRHIR